MAQQTAVEWLISQQKHGKFYNDEIIEQAKKMEKMQTIEFANKWFEEYCEGLGDFLFPEQYYNETYNN